MTWKQGIVIALLGVAILFLSAGCSALGSEWRETYVIVSSGQAVFDNGMVRPVYKALCKHGWK